MGYEEQVGAVGMIIKRGFRELGIGTAMMRILVAQAERMGIEVLTLTAFASKRRALHVYEKAGFVQTGFFPRALEGRQINRRSDNDETVGVKPPWQILRSST